MKQSLDKKVTSKYVGTVIHGKKFGRQLGFPTANLDRRQWSREGMNLKHGVYAGMATVKSGKQYPAGIVIGPLDKLGRPKIEAHLLKFKGSLYGQKLVLIIYEFIRPYKKFKDIQTLKNQISIDMQTVSQILSK